MWSARERLGVQVLGEVKEMAVAKRALQLAQVLFLQALALTGEPAVGPVRNQEGLTRGQRNALHHLILILVGA